MIASQPVTGREMPFSAYAAFRTALAVRRAAKAAQIPMSCEEIYVCNRAVFCPKREHSKAMAKLMYRTVSRM
jgi:hypothetical protein